MIDMNEAAFKKAYDAFAGPRKKLPTKEKLFFAIRAYLEHANKHSDASRKIELEYQDARNAEANAVLNAIPSQPPYTTGVEVHKNEWPIPPGTKLGKRPSQNPVSEQHEVCAICGKSKEWIMSQFGNIPMECCIQEQSSKT